MSQRLATRKGVQLPGGPTGKSGSATEMAKKRVPSYRLHRSSGQAVTTVHGHDHYLGKYDSPESHRKYHQLVERLLSGDLGKPPHDVTLTEVMALYWNHVEAQHYDYRQADRINRSLAVARVLYGDDPAEQFRGRALKAVRQRMIDKGWCRRTVNQRTGCLKRMARWALSEELISADAAGSLCALPPLLEGRTEAPESPRVLPAPPADVDAALPFLGPFLADVVRLQLLTAARPGEVLALHALELDLSREVWIFNLGKHKTRWRGHRRMILVGPRGQEIVRRYLRYLCPACGKTARLGRPCCGPLQGPPALEDYYLFSPALAREERYADKRTLRKTKVQPSQVSRAKARPRKQPGQKYQVSSYDRAVKKACARAGVPAFRPHMLRHAGATEIRREWGIEVAQIVLGHASLQATELYAESDLAKAMEAVKKRG